MKKDPTRDPMYFGEAAQSRYYGYSPSEAAGSCGNGSVKAMLSLERDKKAEEARRHIRNGENPEYWSFMLKNHFL